MSVPVMGVVVVLFVVAAVAVISMLF